MKIQIVRDVPMWVREYWEIEIPDDTPEDNIEEVALDSIYDGNGECVTSDLTDSVSVLDSEIMRVERLDT